MERGGDRKGEGREGEEGVAERKGGGERLTEALKTQRVQ